MRTPAIVLALTHFATAEPVADFSSALEKARSSNQPIAVLVHGSDWNQPGEVLMKSWADEAFAKSTGAGMLLVAIDRKESPNDAEKALAKRNEPCNLPYHSVPALGLYDSHGRLVASRSGIIEIRESGGLDGTLKGMRQVLTDRDALWKCAESATGLNKATFLGKGLDRMNQGLGHKDCYKPILEEIRKADPSDQSGYAAKYAFSSWALLGTAMAKAQAKQPAEAEQQLADCLRNPRLDSLQRQYAHAARFALYQRWPEKKSQSRKALEDMRDANPKSELGIAAARYLEILKDG